MACAAITLEARWGSLQTSFKTTLSSLLSVFKKGLPCFFEPRSLSTRKLFLGGVENSGNSCIFSSLLQDFAALPEVYDSFLFRPIRQGENEDQGHFELREQLQQTLAYSVSEIRAGFTVKKSEIETLASLLQALGWKGFLAPLWRQWLHRLAPSIFSSILHSPLELYEKAFSLLAETFDDQKVGAAHHIVFSAKEDARLPFSHYFQARPEIKNKIDRFLWRVVPQDHAQLKLEENFRIQKQQFSLKLIHAYQKNSSGNHTVVYRNLGSEWICCNDTVIRKVDTLPIKNIFTVVYESQP